MCFMLLFVKFFWFIMRDGMGWLVMIMNLLNGLLMNLVLSCVFVWLMIILKFFWCCFVIMFILVLLDFLDNWVLLMIIRFCLWVLLCNWWWFIIVMRYGWILWVILVVRFCIWWLKVIINICLIRLRCYLVGKYILGWM